MGYYANGCGTIAIPVEDQDDCFRAVMTAIHDAREDRWTATWWFATPPESITDVLGAAFSDVTSGDDGVFEVNHSDKFHNDLMDELFGAIGPFVTEACIDWTGEDDARWRDRFFEGRWWGSEGVTYYPGDPLHEAKVKELLGLTRAADLAAEGDSNDEEVDLLRAALGEAIDLLNLTDRRVNHTKLSKKDKGAFR